MTIRLRRLFSLGLSILASGYHLTGLSLDLEDPKRPIDQIQEAEKFEGISTLRDAKRSQGFFSLGASLYTIGRFDLTGPLPMGDIFPGELNATLSNAAGFNEFEQPLGGRFEKRTFESD